MTVPILPPLKPLPIKDRISVVYVERGNLDVIYGSWSWQLSYPEFPDNCSRRENIRYCPL